MSALPRRLRGPLGAWGLAAVSCLSLAALADLARGNDATPPLRDLAHLWPPLLLGVACAAGVGIAASRAGEGVGLPSDPAIFPWAEALALVAIVAVAAAIRWYRLADLPYGLWFDTAQGGNVAIQILRDPSYRPVFVGDLTQLPALYLYLVAGSIRLLGATPFALRTVGAAAGVATVVAVWGAGRSLLGPRAGLVAAALAAGSSWLLAIDRLAIGSVLVPASIAGAVWCVASGVRWAASGARPVVNDRPRRAKPAEAGWRQAVSADVDEWTADPSALDGAAPATRPQPSSDGFRLLGRSFTTGRAMAPWAARCAAAAAVTAVGLYSYWGAYVAPPIVGLLILVAAGRRAGAGPFGRGARRFWSSALVGGAAYAVALLVAMAPLAAYAAAHPGDFTHRAATITAIGGVAGDREVSLGESALRHALMFWVWGDRNGRHNLAGAPELDPVTGALVVAGAAALVASRGARARGAWLVGWIGIGLLAGIASTPSEAPNAHRTIAIVPAVLLLAAAGLDRLASALPAALADLGLRAVRVAPTAALAAVCGVAVALGTARFRAQQGSPITRAAYSPTETLFARDVDALPAATRVYAGRGLDRGHPTVRFLSPRAAGAVELGNAVYFPPGAPLAVYLAPADRPTLDALRALFPGTAVAPLRPPGGPDLLTRVTATPSKPAGSGDAALATFGGRVAITRATVRGDEDVPGSSWIALGLRAERDAPGYVSASLRAVDAAGHVWGQQDGLGDADLSAWKRGQEGLALVHLRLYGGTPPGRLRLELRLYDLVSKADLAVDGSGAGSLELGPIDVARVVPAGADAPEPALDKRDVPLGDGIRITGVHVGSPDVTQGATEQLDLQWQCLAPDVQGAPLVELVAPSGAPMGTFTAAGGLAAPDTGGCDQGASYLERLALPIGPRWPPGAYQVVARAHAGTGAGIDIGTAHVRALDRQTAVPAYDVPIGAQFDDGIALLGMTVTRDAPDRLTVRLIWQATAPPSHDYTVFVHLLGPDGTIIAQHDGPPANGRWPTTWWEPGQVVEDVHPVSIPDLTDRSRLGLEAGLYDGATGRRLAARLRGANNSDATSVVVTVAW